jgi:hypothetical protein
VRPANAECNRFLLAICRIYWPLLRIVGRFCHRHAAGQGQPRATAVLGWRGSADQFEIPYEVAFIPDSNAVHDFFHIQEGRLQKCSCPLYAKQFEIAGRGHAGVRFEQPAQMRGRQIDGLCPLTKSELLTKVFLHSGNHRLHSSIHSPVPCSHQASVQQWSCVAHRLFVLSHKRHQSS